MQNQDIPRAGFRFARRPHNLPSLRQNCRRQVFWKSLGTEIQQAGFRLARRPLDLTFRFPSCRRQPSWTTLRWHKRIEPAESKTLTSHERGRADTAGQGGTGRGEAGRRARDRGGAERCAQGTTSRLRHPEHKNNFPGFLCGSTIGLNPM